MSTTQPVGRSSRSVAATLAVGVLVVIAPAADGANAPAPDRAVPTAPDTPYRGPAPIPMSPHR
jgi:hypothetical protein